MNRITFGTIFHIKNLWVRRDGENVHDMYHLAFNEDTEIKSSQLPVTFPPITFPLISCGKVAAQLVADPNGYLGKYAYLLLGSS